MKKTFLRIQGRNGGSEPVLDMMSKMRQNSIPFVFANFRHYGSRRTIKSWSHMIAKKLRSSSAYGAKVFVRLASEQKIDRLEAMFNNELLPILAKHHYPDVGSLEYHAAQQEVEEHFHDKKYGDWEKGDIAGQNYLNEAE